MNSQISETKPLGKVSNFLLAPSFRLSPKITEVGRASLLVLKAYYFKSHLSKTQQDPGGVSYAPSELSRTELYKGRTSLGRCKNGQNAQLVNFDSSGNGTKTGDHWKKNQTQMEVPSRCLQELLAQEMRSAVRESIGQKMWKSASVSVAGNLIPWGIPPTVRVA